MAKLDKVEILDKVRADIETAENFFESYIKPDLVERYQIYNADPGYYEKAMPKLSKRSSVVSTDVADAIEWALPSLMRIFFGGEDVVTVVGRGPEDVAKAEIMQELLNFQIQTLNPGFMVFYRWFKDALIGGLGIIKCWWEREYSTEQVQAVLTQEEIEALKKMPDVKIVSVTPFENGVYYGVTYEVKQIEKNQLVFRNVPPNEFLYHPDASNIAEASFVAHRKLVTADYLRRRAQEGLYDKKAVEEVISKGQDDRYKVNYDSLDLALRPKQSQFTEIKQTDEARQKFLLYECYTKYDVNGDGLLEPVVVSVVNDTILRVEENQYRRPPFFVLAPILQPYEIWGKSFADLLKDFQAIKTALIRQVLVNIALNNDPKFEVLETAVNLSDLVQDKQFIRVRQPNAIVPLPNNPLAPWTYNFFEFIEGQKENRVGVTRYNQGLDARSLNNTATGIQLIMSASQQRLELIARIFAETGIKDFFRFLIELNQRFITQKVIMRLTNRALEISSDDLQGSFDLEVAAGMGVGVKEQQLMNYQQILQYVPALVQMGLMTPQNVYNVAKKFFELLGFKNMNDFLTEPQAMPQMMGPMPVGIPPQGGLNGGQGNARQASPEEILAGLEGKGLA